MNKFKTIDLGDVEEMTPIGTLVYIEADKDKNKKIDSKVLDLVVDTTFSPYDDQTVTQDGIVRFVDNVKCDIDIKPGDRVYCHHFLTDEENAVTINNKVVYQQEYFNIYCKIVDGEVATMFRDWNFIEPIEEPEENYKTKSGIFLKPKAETQHKYGIARHINEELRSFGVKEGDKLLFDEAAEYVIRVEGKNYFRIQNRYIYGIVE